MNGNSANGGADGNAPAGTEYTLQGMVAYRTVGGTVAD